MSIKPRLSHATNICAYAKDGEQRHESRSRLSNGGREETRKPEIREFPESGPLPNIGSQNSLKVGRAGLIFTFCGQLLKQLNHYEL